MPLGETLPTHSITFGNLPIMIPGLHMGTLESTELDFRPQQVSICGLVKVNTGHARLCPHNAPLLYPVVHFLAHYKLLAVLKFFTKFFIGFF